MTLWFRIPKYPNPKIPEKKPTTMKFTVAAVVATFFAMTGVASKPAPQLFKQTDCKDVVL
jgi:hypothetical protein